MVSPSNVLIILTFLLSASIQAASFDTKNISTTKIGLHKKWETLQFKNSEDFEPQKEIQTVNGQKRISYHQFILSWGVTIPIFMIYLHSGDSSSALSQIALALNTYSIFLCLPGHFGFYPSFDPFTRPNDIPFQLYPLLKFRKITFPVTQLTITLERWQAVPWFWLCEILIMIPSDECKDQTNLKIYQTIIYFFFVYHALHVFGIFEIYDHINSKFKVKSSDQKELF